MSTVSDPAGAGSANVIAADSTPSLTGKKSLLVHVSSGAGDASESTLSTLLRESDFDAKVGEVQTTPTTNTVLGRLKDVNDSISSGVDSNLKDGYGNKISSTDSNGKTYLDVNLLGGSSSSLSITEGQSIGTLGTPIVGKDSNGNAKFPSVDYLGSFKVTPSDQAGDIDHRMRVSLAHTLFSGKTIYDKQPLKYKEELTNSGTSVFNANESSVTLSTTLSGDKVIRQSSFYPTYQPNKTQRFASTFRFGVGVTGLEQRAGIFDDKNGIFVRLNGTNLEIVLRSFTTGSVVDTIVSQASWNIDPLDGNGRSGATIDITKAQHLIIDYLWLGVGPARIGFRNGGDIVYVHKFNNDNVSSGVYMSESSLPVRWEIIQTGSSAGSMNAFCSVIESEGGVMIDGIERGYISDTGFTFTIGQELPILSIRLASSRVHNFVKITEIGILADDKFDATFKWVLNPTFTGGVGASYSQELDSAVEIDVTRTGTYNNDGHVLKVGAFSDKTRSSSTLSDREVPIGATPSGTSDELVLLLKHRGTNTAGTIYPYIHWVEDT